MGSPKPGPPQKNGVAALHAGGTDFSSLGRLGPHASFTTLPTFFFWPSFLIFFWDFFVYLFISAQICPFPKKDTRRSRRSALIPETTSHGLRIVDGSGCHRGDRAGSGAANRYVGLASALIASPVVVQGRRWWFQAQLCCARACLPALCRSTHRVDRWLNELASP